MARDFNSKEHATDVLHARVEELKLQEPGARILFEEVHAELLTTDKLAPGHDVSRLARSLGAIRTLSAGGLVAAYYPSRPVKGYRDVEQADGQFRFEDLMLPLLFRRYELHQPQDETTFIPVTGIDAELQMREIIADMTGGSPGEHDQVVYGLIALELSAEAARRDLGIDIYADGGYVSGQALFDVEAAQL